MELKKIDLRLPSDRDMLLIIRMTTAGVMSRAGLTLDESDDVKMAVDEACMLLMMQHAANAVALNLSYSYSGQEVIIQISCETRECTSGQSVDQTTMEVVRCILEAMVDEAIIVPCDDGAVASVQLIKKIPDRRRTIL